MRNIDAHLRSATKFAVELASCLVAISGIIVYALYMAIFRPEEGRRIGQVMRDLEQMND